MLKQGWKIWRFDQIALNIKEWVEPSDTDLEFYVGLEHLDPDSLKIRRWGTPDDVGATKLRFKKGDIILEQQRAYQRKVAMADFSGVCSGDIYVFEPKDQQVLLPELLPFICQTEGFFNHAVGTSAGSLSPRTNWKQLAKYEFALPPLEEQRRIAGALLKQKFLF